MSNQHLLFIAVFVLNEAKMGQNKRKTHDFGVFSAYFRHSTIRVSTCLVYRNTLIRYHLSSLFTPFNNAFRSKLRRLNHFLSSRFIYLCYAILTQRGQEVDTDHQIYEYIKLVSFIPCYFIIAIEGNQVKRNHLLISYFLLPSPYALTTVLKYDIIANN